MRKRLLVAQVGRVFTRSWMCFQVLLAGLGQADVGVYLGGSRGGVAQQLLHDAQVCAAIQHVGGKAVAQHVGMDPGINGKQAVALDHLLNGTLGQAPPEAVERKIPEKPAPPAAGPCLLLVEPGLTGRIDQ